MALWQMINSQEHGPYAVRTLAVAEQQRLDLERKFKRDSNYQRGYTDFPSDVIHKGYAEMVPPAQLNGSMGKLGIFLHVVYHLKKKTIRVVFDCGAKFQGTSLNSELIQGPNLKKHTDRSADTFRRGAGSTKSR